MTEAEGFGVPIATDGSDLILGTYKSPYYFYYFDKSPYTSVGPTFPALVRFVDPNTLQHVSCPQIGGVYYMQSVGASGYNYLYLMDPVDCTPDYCGYYPLPSTASFGGIPSFEDTPSVITTFTPIGGVLYGEYRVYDWEITFVKTGYTIYITFDLLTSSYKSDFNCITCGCGISGEICTDDGLHCVSPGTEPPPGPIEPEPIEPGEPGPPEEPPGGCDNQPCGGACLGYCPDDLPCRVQTSGEFGCVSNKDSPFYLQWWFYLIIGLGLIALVVILTLALVPIGKKAQHENLTSKSATNSNKENDSTKRFDDST
jgi:hypothetical protein